MFDKLANSKQIPVLIQIHTMVFFALKYYRFLPNLVFILSERNPTIGVATPSVICPPKIAAEAAGVYTIRLRKKKR